VNNLLLWRRFCFTRRHFRTTIAESRCHLSMLRQYPSMGTTKGISDCSLLTNFTDSFFY